MKADYGWVIFVIIGIALLLAWPMLKSSFGTASDKFNNKEKYEKGKVVFYSDTVWPAGKENRSCAACHAPDFVKTGNRKIEMMEYEEGEHKPLARLTTKYGSNTMTSSDDLYMKVKQCLTSPTRMVTGGMSRDAAAMSELLFYLRKEYGK